MWTASKISIIAFVVALIPALIWYEVIVWRACLADNPWWYCLRILSK